MFHTKLHFPYSFATSFLLMIAVLLAMPTPVQAQYLMVENLQEELLCRAAIKSCLKPVTCSNAIQGKGNYCWENQCQFKSHLTIGFRDVSSSLKIGDIYRSTRKDPFELDVDAQLLGAHVMDCENPEMATAIRKAQTSEPLKAMPAAAMETSAKKYIAK